MSTKIALQNLLCHIELWGLKTPHFWTLSNFHRLLPQTLATVIRVTHRIIISWTRKPWVCEIKGDLFYFNGLLSLKTFAWPFRRCSVPVSLYNIPTRSIPVCPPITFQNWDIDVYGRFETIMNDSGRKPTEWKRFMKLCSDTGTERQRELFKNKESLFSIMIHTFK